MTVNALAAPRVGSSLRSVWFFATIALTAGSFIAATAMAPAADAKPIRALTWLLFVSSSVHVAATGWFFTVPDVRRHARAHRIRYLVVPAALVLAAALTAAAVSPRHLVWLLLGFFGWQFFHFQKQNLGMAALAAAAEQVPSLTRTERRALVAAGVGGIAGLVAHPELLQLSVSPPIRPLFFAGLAVTTAAVCVGVRALLARPAVGRPTGFAVIYLLSLLFFAPVFAFSSPYAAVAGLTLAHGFQYLLIVGLVARGQRNLPSALSLGLLLNIALIGGIALNLASHQHDGSAAMRVLYGGYLGLTMAHFVIDAGLWRLRDEFPRTFLTSALPYLLAKERSAAAATAGHAGAER